ncbi:methylamine utilization protein [Alteromonas sp. 345S023]|uniref:Methylamine utilization protein n=1 Tax=Alteromonas profundi TaxID=2696062 RepID=A0A7X5RLP1_9ALTE|nr:methylamine utilization protein [Alteromonas profundi]NDV92253.1 methylamine utilization protein [Alteromonas profundi]
MKNFPLLLCLLTVIYLPLSMANDYVNLAVTITDADGNKVENGVVIFTPTFNLETPPPSPLEPAIMNQINKQFAPHVLVVHAGTEVSFPNADNLFHHVYSFSPAKQFEVKLYKEFTAEPLLFEQAGIVDIGCNIHDWMLGYIVVADSPFFLKTDADGNAQIDLAKGEYEVRFWHPSAAKAKAFDSDSIVIDSDKSLSLTLDKVVPANDSFDDGFGDY